MGSCSVYALRKKHVPRHSNRSSMSFPLPTTATAPLWSMPLRACQARPSTGSYSAARGSALLEDSEIGSLSIVMQNSLENKCPFCIANMLKVLRQQMESIARAIDEQVAAVSRFEAAYTL